MPFCTIRKPVLLDNTNITESPLYDEEGHLFEWLVVYGDDLVWESCLERLNDSVQERMRISNRCS